jgi:hypothetical protein
VIFKAILKRFYRVETELKIYHSQRQWSGDRTKDAARIIFRLRNHVSQRFRKVLKLLTFFNQLYTAKHPMEWYTLNNLRVKSRGQYSTSKQYKMENKPWKVSAEEFCDKCKGYSNINLEKLAENIARSLSSLVTSCFNNCMTVYSM